MAAPSTTTTADSTRDRSDRARVLADQDELLYRQAPLGIGVTFIIGIVLFVTTKF